MMDKVKAYDEALEKARQDRDAYQKELNKTDKNSQLANILRGGISAIEKIFPELRESEDERIRKALIEGVRQIRCKNGITQEQMVAYLEKQNIFSKNGEGCYYYHADGSYTFIGSMGFWPVKDMKLNGERPKTDNKSVDISLPEWNEEDKKMFIDILNVLTTVLVYSAGKGTCTGATIYKYDKEIKWFKSLPERFNHQPKQKWSEEDKRAIDRACVALRSYANGDLPEFLPSELIGYADRLQSLRPSWKPSEEQMEAFKKYIEEFQARAEAAVGGWNNFDVMIRLYEQLKKL